MNLQRVSRNTNTEEQLLLTTGCCNKMVAIGRTVADLDAPFGTFWCEDCARCAGHKMPDHAVQLYPR